MKHTILNLMLVLMVMVAVTPAQAQVNDEMVIRVNTFARQANFIAKENSLSLTIREGIEDLQPEKMEVRSIDQVIIAIDNSDSMKYILPDLVKKLKKVLPENPMRPIAIAAFNEQVEMLANFTTAKVELKSALDRLTPVAKNTRIFAAMKEFQSLSVGRTTQVILITDGNDTTKQAVNIKQLLSQSNITFSYLNWGYVDPSLQINEPGYVPVKKSSLIKVKPNRTLSIIAERSGGEVINVTDWDNLTDYLKQQFQAGNYLYRCFWYSNNPEGPYKLLLHTNNNDRMLARN